MILKTITFLFLALTGLATAMALPDVSAGGPVTLALFILPTCTDHPARRLVLEANTCYSLGGAHGLQIIEKEEGLKYNACKYTFQPSVARYR